VIKIYFDFSKGTAANLSLTPGAKNSDMFGLTQYFCPPKITFVCETTCLLTNAFITCVSEFITFFYRCVQSVIVFQGLEHFSSQWLHCWTK
jgi:hypothetical protein